MIKYWMVVAILFGFGNSVFAQSRADVPKIEVTVTGSVEREPELARVSFAVEVTRKTAQQAAQANAEMMNSLFAALEKMDIDREHIRTSAYRVFPKYPDRYRNEAEDPQPIGYTVQNQVQVEIAKIKEVGKVIDGAIQAGANRVESVTFGLHHPEKAYQDALESAMKEAKLQAQILALAAGGKLGDPLNIRTSGGRPVMREASVRFLAKANTPIEAGGVQVSATVTVIYGLKME